MIPTSPEITCTYAGHQIRVRFMGLVLLGSPWLPVQVMVKNTETGRDFLGLTEEIYCPMQVYLNGQDPFIDDSVRRTYDAFKNFKGVPLEDLCAKWTKDLPPCSSPTFPSGTK